MTDQEFDELDRLLAEKLMGWPIQAQPPYDWPHLSWNDHESVKVLWLFEMGKDGTFYTQRPWHPTRDIAQAMMVAEKIGQLKLHQSDGGSWYAGVADKAGL